MRRHANFAAEQLEFVGKLTMQQQAVRLPSSNAEQMKELAAVASGPFVAPITRVGSS